MKIFNLISIFITFFVILFIPIKILSLGWYPIDDALRHCAYATNEKTWGDILVINPEYNVDHNSGWHSILKLLFRWGFTKQDLLDFSVVSLFILINLSFLIISGKAEIYLFCIFIILLTEKSYIFRLIQGRPFLVSTSVFVLLLSYWNECAKKNTENLFYSKYFFLSMFLLTLSQWIHGSCYLFLVFPLCFCLAKKYKIAVFQLISILIAFTIGSLLTGSFYKHMSFFFHLPYKIFTEKIPTWLLVDEFQPSGGPYITIFVFIIFFFLIKKIQIKEALDSPLILMLTVCWLFGLINVRFFLDYGIPALFAASSYFIKKCKINFSIYHSSLIVLVLGLSIYFMTTSDIGGRYSKRLLYFPIDFTNEYLKDWKPNDNGIIYSNDMRVFYEHFFVNSTANYKYILGFESAMMNKDDLDIYRKLCFSGQPDDFIPWIKKMKKGDRLILNYKIDELPGIEWKQGSRTFWIGRLKDNYIEELDEYDKKDKDLRESFQQNVTF